MKAQAVQLGEVCQFVYGEALKEESRRSGTIPVYGSNGVVGWHDKALTRGATIVIGRKGSIGEVNWSNGPCFPIDTTYYVDKTERPCDLRWLYYTLVKLDLTRLNKSAAIPGLNRDDAYEQRIRFPDVPEQEQIAALLDQADRLRRTRRYALELTDTFLPAAFLELFGDPAENPRAFDRLQVEGLFSDSRDGAKCGPFGSALKKHEYVAAGIPVWTMNNVRGSEFLEDGCLYITPQKFEELVAYDAQNGDILISRAGTVGRMAIVRTKHPRSIIHTNMIRLSLNHAKILPIYFVTLMTWFAPRVARLKRGQEDAYTFMSTGSLGELQIPLPPYPLQQKFAALVEQVERLRAVQQEASRQAEHLFASVLHSAFSS